MKKIIGITGSSGSGKSSVSKILESRGAHVIDADQTARAIVAKESDALFEIASVFGNSVINSDGTLNRAALAEIVFSDSDLLRMLNEITHKYIIDEIKEELKRTQSETVIIDAPLLFDAGLDELCDICVTVTADKEIKTERIKSRDHLSDKEAKARLSSQRDDSFLAANSDYVIENNGTEEELKEKVNEFVRLFL